MHSITHSSVSVRRNSGFSLVELMIALVAGLIVSTALVAFTMSSFKSNSEYVLSTRLTQELRNTLDTSTRDLRRAGYNENALSMLATGNSSPFDKIFISGECVLYTYDRANNAAGSALGVLDQANGEIRGLRRKSVTNAAGLTVGVIEYGESDATGKPSCTGASATYTSFPPACNATSHWCALSDPSILNITALTLTDSHPTAGTQITLRDIGVSISGQLVNSNYTSFARTVTSSVRVRSDCFMPTATYNCTTSP